MQEFTQLGIAGLTLGILFFIVRYFVKSMEKKDEYIQTITKQFSDTVNTHLANENEARQKEMQVLSQHTQVLGEITKVLSSHTDYFVRLEQSGKFGRRKYDR